MASPESRTKTGRKPGTFQPGKSGNPGGRPKADIRLKDLAREHTDAAIDTLVKGLKAKGERTRIAAAEALLDRGYGKPSQHHEVDAGDDLAAFIDQAWKRTQNGGNGGAAA